MCEGEEGLPRTSKPETFELLEIFQLPREESACNANTHERDTTLLIDLHLECNEGGSLDTTYGPTGFSAFMGPRANMYVARCVLGCVV